MVRIVYICCVNVWLQFRAGCTVTSLPCTMSLYTPMLNNVMSLGISPLVLRWINIKQRDCCQKARWNKPVRSLPLWPELQFLPSGFCLEYLLQLLSVMGWSMKVIRRNKPFSFKLLMAFSVTTKTELRQKTGTRNWVAGTEEPATFWGRVEERV